MTSGDRLRVLTSQRNNYEFSWRDLNPPFWKRCNCAAAKVFGKATRLALKSPSQIEELPGHDIFFRTHTLGYQELRDRKVALHESCPREFAGIMNARQWGG